MTPKGKISPALIAAIVVALLTAAFGVAANSYSLFRGLIHASYDFLLVARGERHAEDAVIVFLDERSHAEMNQPLNAPWDRKLHAQLIQRLTAAGAKAIVFDVVFSDPSVAGREADEVLAAAIKSSGRVILAGERVPMGGGDYRTLMPTELLRESLSDDQIGSAEVIPDADLSVRKLTPEFDLPSLSWVAAKFVGARVTKSDLPSRERWLNYYGPPGSVLSVSYCEALKPGKIEDSFFRDKVVFVGSRIITKFAGERKDEYRTPFGFFVTKGAMFVPGVEIQATACMNLLREDWLRRLPPSAELSILILAGLVIGFGLMRLPPLTATGVATLLLVLLFGVCYVAVLKLSWFVFFIVVVQVGFALVVSVAYNSLQAYVQKRLAEQSLALYLSPKLVKKFATNPQLLKPGAEKQTLTLFFSDIASFTTLSEGMDSNDLAHLMNNYFETAVSQCIHKTDGTVVKYIGDAIFAFWNAPEPQANHAAQACEAALRFRDSSAHSAGGLKLITRIGLHTGVANVGNFGSVERVDYTALGENVNLASRLEGLNKYLDTNCVLSGDTYAAMNDQFVTRAVGVFRLKGFERAVSVYELVGWPHEAESTRLWREAFRVALASYQRGDLASAREGFEAVLSLKPEDGPAKFYLERIAEFGNKPVPNGWTGDITLKEK